MGETDRRGGWAYLSLVTALPGIDLSVRAAVVVQFAVFEGFALLLAAAFGHWEALPFATAAVLVATAGSALMLTLDERIRTLEPPGSYREALFDSSVDVVMGLVAYALLVTHLLLGAREPDGGLLVQLLGEPLPAVGVAFALVIAWDVCYRIGTAWWVGLTGLWRTLRYADEFDAETRVAYLGVERLTVGFAALQLVLVPFVWPDRFLTLVIAGHVAAVVAVSSVSAWRLRP